MVFNSRMSTVLHIKLNVYYGSEADAKQINYEYGKPAETHNISLINLLPDPIILSRTSVVADNISLIHWLPIWGMMLIVSNSSDKILLNIPAS